VRERPVRGKRGFAIRGLQSAIYQELTMSADPQAAHEPHPWLDLTPDDVLDRLVHELYTPVSALGSEVDRLASGTFEDDDLIPLLHQIRENLNALGRLVVTLKRYTSERQSLSAEDASAEQNG
jgi:hypothetical protein